MRFRLFVLSLLFAFLASGVSAADWVVERATSGVSISADGKSWKSVKKGAVIPNSYWVRTGARGRAILAKGSERILYRANTLAAISVSQPTGQKTRIRQQRGSILLAVEKRRRQHTSVVTPHLAAVVKGTVFEVSVERGASSVRVDRGLVEVTEGDMSVEVAPGQRVAAGRTARGLDVKPAKKTSITANGRVGLELADISSDAQSRSNIANEVKSRTASQPASQDRGGNAKSGSSSGGGASNGGGGNGGGGNGGGGNGNN